MLCDIFILTFKRLQQKNGTYITAGSSMFDKKKLIN